MFKSIIKIAVCAGLLAINASQAQDGDPTRPLGAVSISTNSALGGDAAPGVTLNSILMANDRKIAIINGQTVRENQTLKSSGAIVRKIEADSVTLQQGDRVWRLTLDKVAIRK